MRPRKTEDDRGVLVTRYSLRKGAHLAITRMTITGTRVTESARLPPDA